MELVRGVATCRLAGFSGFFVGFGFFFVPVEFDLDWAFYVIAEFSALILREAFVHHAYQDIVRFRWLIRVVFQLVVGV